MGKLFSLLLLKNIVSTVKRPMVSLLKITFVSLVLLAVIKDLSVNGLLPVWLALLIKWTGLAIMASLALKPLAGIRASLSQSLLFKNKASDKKWKEHALVQKPVLLRRKDVLAKKYAGTYQK